MISQENITTIKRLGVESGEIEIWCHLQSSSVSIEFKAVAPYTSFTLEDIELGKMCFIKESRVIGDVNLGSIKTSEEAEKAKRLLNEELEKMMPELIVKAHSYAEEIRERAGTTIEVIEEINGEPGVMTEHDQNMWHASEVLRGIDDDY